MRKIISSLLFSTATLGGVVGIVAQTNQANSTTASEAPAPSLQATETTKAVLDVETITPAPASAEATEQASPLATTLVSLSKPAPAPVSKPVTYEEVQTIRTGYKPVAPELIEAKPAPVVEEAPKAEVIAAASTVKENLATAVAAQPAINLSTDLKEAPVVAVEEVAVTSVVTEASTTSAETTVTEATSTPATSTEVVTEEPVIETTTQAAAPVTSATTEAVSSEAPKAESLSGFKKAEAAVAPKVETKTSATTTTTAPKPTTEAVTNPTTKVAEVSKPTTTTTEATTTTAPTITAPETTVAETVARVEEPSVTLLSNERVATPAVATSANPYPIGQCTWGVKALASWVGNNWGNASQWANSARAAGYSVGTTPTVGAVAVWPNDGGGYGHVALVTAVESSNRIQVSEANYAGNQSIGNYRGWFNPTDSIWGGGTVYYIYPSI